MGILRMPFQLLVEVRVELHQNGQIMVGSRGHVIFVG